MFEITTDEDVFKKFWQNDAEKMPAYFQNGTHAFETCWDDFKGFCEQCDRIYLIDNVALLYVERRGQHANIHFSLVRGETIDIADLIKIRGELFKDFEMIFGWIGSKNRGLKQIIEQCGFHYDGFYMLKGQSHGKVLEWQCYSIRKHELFSRKSNESLVTFV